MRKMFMAAALAVAAISSAAYAAMQDFTINNRSGYTVVTLNVSPSSSNNWGPDILGRDVLANGESAEITFDRNETECMWDIRATYSDGDVGDWRNVNLCETTEINLTP